MPWLTGTAFLHSVMMQEKRGMLKIWNMWLVFITFWLAILGTFLTRSGIPKLHCAIIRARGQGLAVGTPRYGVHTASVSPQTG